MDKRNRYRRHSGAGKVIAAVLLVLVLLCGAAWIVLFRINQFSLSVQLLGDKETTQEYGQPYQDPGVIVSMRGSLFWKKGFRPKRGWQARSGDRWMKTTWGNTHCPIPHPCCIGEAAPSAVCRW